MIVRELRRGQIASWENLVPKFLVSRRSFLPVLYHEQPHSTTRGLSGISDLLTISPRRTKQESR